MNCTSRSVNSGSIAPAAPTFSQAPKPHTRYHHTGDSADPWCICGHRRWEHDFGTSRCSGWNCDCPRFSESSLEDETGAAPALTSARQAGAALGRPKYRGKIEGRVTRRRPGSLNAHEVRGDVAVLFLERRNGEVIEAVIDAADLPQVLTNPSWHAWLNPCTGTFYVKRVRRDAGRKRTEYLHRFLMGSPAGLDVDHKDHDSLNNRRANLRAVRHCVNSLNRRGPAATNKTSGIRGVHWSKVRRKWVAFVQFQGRNQNLGGYDTKDDAAAAVKAKLMELAGVVHA